MDIRIAIRAGTAARLVVGEEEQDACRLRPKRTSQEQRKCWLPTLHGLRGQYAGLCKSEGNARAPQIRNWWQPCNYAPLWRPTMYMDNQEYETSIIPISHVDD